MDKTSKKILTALKSAPNNRIYYTSDPHVSLGLDKNEFFRCVRYLESIGYIDIVHNQDGRSLGITITHLGMHSTYFSFQRLKDYWTEKWIDMLAMIISLLSLIISFLALIFSLVS